MAEFLIKENPADYTFHSFRRTCATLAADSGASAQQMQDFFGWKNASMTMEYISTSKAAVMSMASNLNPVKEKEVEVKQEGVGEGEEKLEEGGDGKEDINPGVTLNPVKRVIPNAGHLSVAVPSIMNNQKVVVIYGDFNGTIM
jgi:hypothetical protein